MCMGHSENRSCAFAISELFQTYMRHVAYFCYFNRYHQPLGCMYFGGCGYGLGLKGGRLLWLETCPPKTPMLKPYSNVCIYPQGSQRGPNNQQFLSNRICPCGMSKAYLPANEGDTGETHPVRHESLTLSLQTIKKKYMSLFLKLCTSHPRK